MHLIHVAIPVSDLEATQRFYLDGLGFARTHAFDGADGLRNVYVSDEAGTELQFTYRPDEAEPVPTAPVHHRRQHIAVAVADLDAAFDALVETVDPRVLDPPGLEAESGSRIAFVADPDGHVVELVERPESA